MLSWRLLFLSLLATPFLQASSGTVLVIPFHNESQYNDLNWIGESIAETLMSELGSAGQIVLDRDTRHEGYRRLDLKADALFTKATLLKLGQTLDADHICYGTYQVTLPSAGAQLRDGTIRISARFLDLRKLREGAEFSETGKLLDLSKLEEHLSYQTIRYLDPHSSITPEQLLQPSKLTRLDAKESYIRGLLLTAPDQKRKWFEQAAKLDPQYAQAAFELGRLSSAQKDYGQAAEWFGKIPETDPLYLEARFRMGLNAYLAGKYETAETCFRELSKTVPLNEVYNNLGAAEGQLGKSGGLEDLRRASEGDETDAIYHFNMAVLLYRAGNYEQAIIHLNSVLDKNPDDKEARALLVRSQQRTPASNVAGNKTDGVLRLKQNFDLSAFRQLKALLQPSK